MTDNGPKFTNCTTTLPSHEALRAVADRIRSQAGSDLDTIVADLIQAATENHRPQEDDCPRGHRYNLGACEDYDTAVTLALSWLLGKVWESD